MPHDAVVRIEKALDEIRAGRMVILIDDEDRENEGDLVMAADKVTPEAINFMARFARGLICLTLTENRVRQLELPMMVDDNKSPRSTAFTISIEARDGVTTGISAADRARTVQVAVDPDARPSDLVSPGHIFPLRGVRGGVLRRAGHTEGSIDLARLAGRSPAGVICEVMNDDGTMARYPDLETFAKEHNLLICTIADLIEYRLMKERLVHRELSGPVTLFTGKSWTAHAYSVEAERREFLALTLGDVGPEPTLVRVHTGSTLGDIFGVPSDNRSAAARAIEAIEKEGSGVLLFLPSSNGVINDLRYFLPAGESSSAVRDSGDVLREFGLGAQVLADLGLRKVRLMTNHPRRIVGLEGYHLEIVEQVALD